MAPSTCCCCCPLRCGTITIGVLSLIAHGLETIGLIIAVILTADETDRDPDLRPAVTGSCVALGFMGTWFLLDMLLLRGLTTDRRPFVLAWLCWAMPLTLLAVICACVLLYLMVAYADEEPALVAVPIVALVEYLLHAYWVTVVLIYYRSMAKTARQRAAAARTAQVAPSFAYGQTAMPVTMAAQQPGMVTIAPGYQQPTYNNPMASYPKRHLNDGDDDRPAPMRRY